MGPSFEDLLTWLREAHERQLQELKQENDTLRAQVQGQSQDGPTNGEGETVEQKPKSEWRSGLHRTPSISEEEVKGSFAVAHSAAHSEPAAGEPQPQEPKVCPDPPEEPEEPSAALDNHVAVRSQDRSSYCSQDLESITGTGSLGRRMSWAGRRMSRMGPGRPFSVFESVVPTAISFDRLCEGKYGSDKRWAELEVHERVELLRAALKPKHNLISPHCYFMKRWDFLISVALFFVGLVTPYEVVFLADVEWGLFAINRVVDLIFLLDIVLQFFLVVEIHQPHRGGSIMVRNPRIIRMRYLKSWFFVDVVSIFPFDAISIGLASSTEVLQRAKILRCLKMLRIIKLLRMLRSSKILGRWKNSIALPFATQKLITFLVVLAFISHWMACVWGLCGLTFGATMCDSAGQLVTTSVDVSKVSWVTTLYLGGKTSPDTPCSHFAVYTASLHWAVMTLTSIGYGDIVPVRLEEYIVGIICMLAGGVLWAYVIGSLCSIISNASQVEKNFEANTDLLNLAMQEANVPKEERPKYREFLREAKAYDRRVSFGQVADSFSPMLRKELMYFVTKDVLQPTYYFREAPQPFMMEIASALGAKFFSRREPLEENLRNCLCMLDRGTIAHGRRVLVPPSVFNEDFIVCSRYQHNKRTLSLTYTQVLILPRDVMDELLEPYPWFERRIRRCAGKLAFCRALQMARIVQSRWAGRNPKGDRLSLSEAFDRVCSDGRLRLSRLGTARSVG